MGIKQKAALLAAMSATLVSALAASAVLGREVRVVELLALFAGGFGSGASVTFAIVSMRPTRRRALAAGSNVDTEGEASGDF